MSEEPVRTKVSGRLTLLSTDGANCRVVADGAGDKAFANFKDSKAALQAEELEKARKSAYKQGWDDCQKKMAADLSRLNAQLDEARRQLPEALNAYFNDLEAQMKGEIAELAFKVAEALLGAEMERRDLTMEAVGAALGPLLSASGVKIHVSPSFLAKGANPAPAGASFVADPKLKTGEIMVDSPQGLIDGRLESRLAALKADLLKRLTQEPANA